MITCDHNSLHYIIDAHGFILDGITCSNLIIINTINVGIGKQIHELLSSDLTWGDVSNNLGGIKAATPRYYIRL